MQPGRSHRTVLAGALLALLGALAPASAQSGSAKTALPLRVDCGDLNGFAEAEPGWQLLGPEGGVQGVTLDPPPLDAVHVAGSWPYYGVGWPSDVMVVDPDEVGQAHALTALQLAGGTVLTVSGLAKNKVHRVKLELGAASPWMDLVDWSWVPHSTVSRRVLVEVPQGKWKAGKWRHAAQEVRCTGGYLSNSWQCDLGAVVPVWVLAKTNGAGTLKLRLSTAGGDPLFLSGFEVHAPEPLPITYKRTKKGPLKSGAKAAGPFVAAFNAGDFDGAQAVAYAMADPFLRGTALMWLAGWLDGSRDGRVALLPDARAALAEAQAEHPAAARLIDDIDRFQRALDHLEARGYSQALACPSEGGKGFLNTDCAGQITLFVGNSSLATKNVHIGMRLLGGLAPAVNGATVLEDVAAWNAGQLKAEAWEPSPLLFAAVKRRAQAQTWIDPLLKQANGDPESAAFLDELRAVFNGFMDLGFFASDFPRDMELPLFRKYVTNPKGNPKDWTKEEWQDALTDEQIAQSWWGGQVAMLPDDPAAPPWANLDRNVGRIARNAIDYWLNVRRRDNELGGGWGDDVELLLQLFPTLAARQEQGDRLRLDALDSLIHHGLLESPELVDGYFAGEVTDPEHGGEYTTNPWLAVRALQGHSALAVTSALGVGQHLKSAGEPALAFAAPSSVGRWHMRNTMFSALEVSSDPATAYDTLLHGRTMTPAVFTGLHAPLAASHPLTADLRDWALGWRTDALDTSGLSSGKPSGFLAETHWPSNQMGTAGKWYSLAGETGDPGLFTSGELTYVLQLLQMSYRTSAAGDRWMDLVPAARMFRAAKDWEDAGQPASPAVGGKLWAGQQLKSDPRFGGTVLTLLSDLESDPQLTTLADPLVGGGTPYVDAALVQRLHAWVSTQYIGQGNAMTYAMGELAPACALHSSKSTNPVSTLYEAWLAYMRACFPLVTSQAMHTDRVFLNVNLAQAAYLGAHVGAPVVEGLRYAPLLRWSRPGGALDAAILVNHRDAASTAVSAFTWNFSGEPLDVRLGLDEGLVPGSYLLEVGPGETWCDGLPYGANASEVVQKRGAGVAADVTLPPGLSVVRATRTGAADLQPQRYDLAVDPPRVELDSGASQLTVRARVVNGGSDPSPPAQLQLWATVLDPAGTPVAGATETLLATHAIPSLAGSTGFTAAEKKVTTTLPLSANLATQVLAGQGLQLRAVVSADAFEADLLNNELTRAWYLDEIPP